MERTFILFIGYFIPLSFLMLGFTNSAEKGIPYITNYPTRLYKAHNQNWKIIQDNGGFIYFSNGDKVLFYVGNSWEHIELHTKI